MKSRLRKKIFRLHKLLQVHIIDQSLLFTLQPDKRGLWLTRIPNVDTFDMSMTKLLKKLKRHTISSSIVTELFAESIELTFVEFSEMDQTTTSENVWKALRVYDPSLIALIYVEFVGPKIFTRFEVMSTGMTVGDIERIRADFPKAKFFRSEEHEAFKEMPSYLRDMYQNLSPFDNYQNKTEHMEFFKTKADRCSRCGSNDTKLKLCSGCKAVRYCSSECQLTEWRSNGHKEACKWLGHLVTRTFKHL